MQINPEALEFGDLTDLNLTNKEEFESKLERMLENNNVIAIGPKEHLEALKRDLILAGYKKMK